MTLVWKEMRELLPRMVAAGLLTPALVIGPYLLILTLTTDAMFAYLKRAELLLAVANVPLGSVVYAVGLVIWALWIAYDALAGEAADRTWTFLFTRPIPTRRLVAAKVLLRGATVLGAWLAMCGAIATLVWVAPALESTSVSAGWAELRWVLTRPPHITPYLAFSVLACGLLTFGSTIVLSSATAHRGIVLGLGGTIGTLTLFGHWFLWQPLVLGTAAFQVPRTGVAVLCVAALVSIAAACLRVGTMRQPRLWA